MRRRLLFATFIVALATVVVSLVAAQFQTEAEVMPMDAVLRLRAAPSVESAILDLLPPGSPLDVIGRTQDSRWLAVRTQDGKAGWVWSEYLIVYIDLAPVCVVNESNVLSSCAEFGADVAINIVQTYQRGQSLGNRPDTFAKVGDSITESTNFLHPIGVGMYNLGSFTDLQAVINHFAAGRIGSDNSFTRNSAAAGVGWAAASVLDSHFTDSAECLPDEIPLDCEYRIVRPSIALIMFGTNDVGYQAPEVFRANIDRIVRTSVERGVIPILSTIPYRADYEDAVRRFNAIITEVAFAHYIPLWDYGSAMDNLPDRGLSFDGVHPSEGPRGYDGAANFASENLNYGYVIRNLTALQMLNAVWRLVQ